MKCKYEHSDSECCGQVKERVPLTAYHYDEDDRKNGKEDPNKVVLCDEHYEEYKDHWTEMWREYNGERL